MTNEQIRAEMASNNAKIKDLIDPAFFVLNDEIRGLLNRNKELTLICTHEFENGSCIFCGRRE